MESESEYINKVISALKKVPEKRLLIIELANQIPIKNGEFDCDALTDLQPKINLAIAEAKMYGAYTIRAVDSLVRLQAGEEE